MSLGGFDFGRDNSTDSSGFSFGSTPFDKNKSNDGIDFGKKDSTSGFGTTYENNGKNNVPGFTFDDGSGFSFGSIDKPEPSPLVAMEKYMNDLDEETVNTSICRVMSKVPLYHAISRITIEVETTNGAIVSDIFKKDYDQYEINEILAYVRAKEAEDVLVNARKRRSQNVMGPPTQKPKISTKVSRETVKVPLDTAESKPSISG